MCPLCHWGGSGFSGCGSASPLAVDTLGALGCGVGPPWIGLVGPVHPKSAQVDWVLGRRGQRSRALCPLGPIGCTGPFLSCPAFLPICSGLIFCGTRSGWPLVPTGMGARHGCQFTCV